MSQATVKHSKKNRPPYAPKKLQKDEHSPALLAKDVGKGLLITVGIGVLLTLVGALIAYFCADPIALIPPLSLIAAALTSFLGGLISARIHGQASLLCGLLNGTLLMALMIFTSLFFRAYASGYTGWLSCILHVGVLLLSVLGGFVAQHKPAKPARSSRRTRKR